MSSHDIDPKSLRSYRWFGPDDQRSFGHRSRIKQMGYSGKDYLGKPVVGILNTWSELNPCHVHLRERAEAVKRGVWQSGGFPVELPVMSLDESYIKPTSMLYRNLLAMEAEETIRCHPLDGVILMGGCDKTTPALIMGATSAAVPFLYFSAGPMIPGYYNGERLGSGSDMWKYWAERCAGNLCDEDWHSMEDGIARSPGHCMTMGTASTMSAIAESLGLMLPGSSSVPAVHADHVRVASECGRRIIEMIAEDLTPNKVLTAEAFHNACVTIMAVGASTNSLVHILAMAGRAGVPLDLDYFDQFSRSTPTLANVRPSGEFLMEDFFEAGGLPALLEVLRPHLKLDCLTVNGKTIGENIAGKKIIRPEVIRTLDNPISETGGVCVLKGNLAPDGCVMKPTAANDKLLKHTGPAVVFENYADLKERLNDPDLDVTEDSVLVLRDAGPIGGPGMPEWGMLPIPNKLLKKGVRDMVRISDARMSGTSYGSCILHVAPESAVGGPLAFVKTGDQIALDVEARTIELCISDQEMESRRQQWTKPDPYYGRGFGYLFSRHVTQANKGCDFDFLHNGPEIPQPDIY